MDKRIILLCYPEWEDFSASSEMYPEETTSKEREEQFFQFVTELKVIPNELNQVINLLRDYYRKSNKGISIPNLEVNAIALGSESVFLDPMEEENSYIRVCLAPTNCPSVREKTIKSLQGVVDRISHLIYIEIPPEKNTDIKWNDHREEPFDATLTSGMRNVKYVVLSIIFDILLYYVMGFPDSLEYRKTVAEKKTPIIKKQRKSALTKIYGTNTVDDNVYLPVTLATIKGMEAEYSDQTLFESVKNQISKSKKFIEEPKQLFVKLQEATFEDFKSSCYNNVYLLYHKKEKWEDIYAHVNSQKKLLTSYNDQGESIYITIPPWGSERFSRLDELFANDALVECIKPNQLYSFVLENLHDNFIKAMNMGLHAQLLFFKQGDRA